MIDEEENDQTNETEEDLNIEQNDPKRTTTDKPFSGERKKIETDKITEEFREILQWWNAKKIAHLDLSSIDSKLCVKFLQSRENFKSQEIKRLSNIREIINSSIIRRKQALSALPIRLSFACQISSQPQWREDLPNHISLTYDKLHLLNYSDPEIEESQHRIKIDPRYGLPAKLTDEEIKAKAEYNAKLHSTAIYSIPESILDDFPPAYDPGDIRTQPAYVRSLFDYQWKEGMDAPIRTKTTTLDAHQSIIDEERTVYGQDMSGLDFGKITKSSNIGGGEELKKKLQTENQKLTAKQKKIFQKNVTQKGTKDYKEMLEKKAEQRRMNKNIRKWHYDTKNAKNRKTKELSVDGDGEDGDSDGDEVDEIERKLRAQKRIRDLEIVGQELPKLEELLVNKKLNKEFFEQTLPLVMDHPLTDDSKREDCILLLRKFHTIQSHVGYNVK